ncbi:nuclear receptor-interacting protein 2 isoform X3 [Grus americana]|uniref:nuclear receptor-interacting protein 2 isoform X3 n=1 Tax=Grus americana TaxID=9117 RepID=UPI0024085FAC|nr:nuclear receptor-interacting protein 2 isoform X3 [Grus americana]
MSTRNSCPLPLGQGDREEKQIEGTPDLERQESEVELRNKAILQQKRRLKQATQFVHKDSADLLPLDGLTRLGTSKDLCQGQVLKATVNTGCLPNLISKSCLNQLGLEEVSAMDCGDPSLPIPSVVGRVEHMEMQFGQKTVLCSALVVDDEMMEFCIGLQTLLSLKCCIDLEEGVLRFKALSQELPFLHASEEPEHAPVLLKPFCDSHASSLKSPIVQIPL